VGVDARNVGDRVRRSGTRLPREGENAAGEEERRDDECRWESFIHAGKPRCLLRDVARRFRTDAKCVPSLKRAKREIESSNIRKTGVNHRNATTCTVLARFSGNSTDSRFVGVAFILPGGPKVPHAVTWMNAISVACC
jgi:hypothetical protein